MGLLAGNSYLGFFGSTGAAGFLAFFFSCFLGAASQASVLNQVCALSTNLVFPNHFLKAGVAESLSIQATRLQRLLSSFFPAKKVT